jgi:indolepyruvate ferredoxin oxidoreductase, alpha subunit
MREILTGNEAIARGAWEAGVRFASAYPGTPSSEILQNMSNYKDVYSEWSTNEKVAAEAAIGASYAGARAMCAMKHVGVNVAADPLFTASYAGVGGGFVLVTADEPGQHSSQNEQDNRNFGKFAKVPVIEPTDSQEAKDWMKIAFELSEEFDTPVIYRSTTRISHSKSIVELGERPALEPITELKKDMQRYTMLPAFSRLKHPIVEQRIKDLAERGATLPVNQIEINDTRVGIVACGVGYQYAREAFPNASFFKVGMTYPLSPALVKEFASKVEKLYVVEELDPFLEEQIKLMGVRVDGGKDILPMCGEFDARLVATKLHAAGVPGVTEDLLVDVAPAVEGLPNRPPTLCPGCSHRGVFSVLSRLKVYVNGDIGCYTLGALPPFDATHTCICMGAGITMAHGMSKVVKSDELKNKNVAIIGDSTFFHSGLTGLVDVVWNKSNTVVALLDNRTTAMTGGQETPGMGLTLMGEPAPEIDLFKLVEAIGVKRIRQVDSYNLEEIEKVFREELAVDEPSVVITKDPCVLEYKVNRPAMQVDSELCNGCKRCLRAGCIALTLVAGEEENQVVIDEAQCNGCEVCAQLCRFDAISFPATVEA